MKMENVKKIAVFRALQLGDMLCAVPAFRALRAAYPDAEICLLGLPWGRDFVTRFSDYFNKFIHFPGFPGLPEQPFEPGQWEQFTDLMHEAQFDLILQMQGNGSIVNDMLAGLGARYLAGFQQEGGTADPDFFLTYPEGISEIHKHLRLMAHLGIPSRGDDLEFPISQEETAALQKLNLPISPSRYVCIHPGSRGAWRQWPPANFALMADYCSGLGLRVLITGTKGEHAICEQVASLMECPAINIAGATGLGEIGQLIKGAALLVSNCTGVSHIAAATQTPSLVISMDGEPERWGPLNHELHYTIDWTRSQHVEAALSALQFLLKKHADA